MMQSELHWRQRTLMKFCQGSRPWERQEESKRTLQGKAQNQVQEALLEAQEIIARKGHNFCQQFIQIGPRISAKQ